MFKYIVYILFYSGLTVLLLISCNDCRDEDCPDVNFIDIRVESGTDTVYVYDINFYFYNHENHKVEADIIRASGLLNTFYASLDFRQPVMDDKYYLTEKDFTQEVELQRSFQQTDCCGTQVWFEKIIVDGSLVNLPIEVVID